MPQYPYPIQAGEEGSSSLESPPGGGVGVPQKPSTTAWFADQVTEAGSSPRSPSTAGSETQLPDSQSWVFPLPLGALGEQEWKQDSG